MNKFRTLMQNIGQYLKALVNISDHIDPQAAVENIHQNIRFRGPNVLILMCAILIASLGLNVNSTAVIIGAMLISPLMGPILGMGLALGTNDLNLFKASLRNWGVMVVISILVATVYFVLSPLEMESPTELLARTTPTIYDVLIALFGGIAGILETARKEKGTVLSGVAIATALMPPLCTVGYGISQLNLAYTFGALYLFCINSVLIAVATFVMVRWMRFPIEQEEDKQKQQKRTRWITVLIILFVVPSFYTGYQVIHENNIKRAANKFIAANKTIGKSYIFDHKLNNNTRPATLELFVAGDQLEKEQEATLLASAEEYGFRAEQIVIRQDVASDGTPLDEQAIVRDIFENTEQRVQAQKHKNDSLQALLNALQGQQIPTQQLVQEINSQYPSIESCTLATGSAVSPTQTIQDSMVVVLVSLKEDRTLSEEDRQRLQSWLKIRLNKSHILVLEQP